MFSVAGSIDNDTSCANKEQQFSAILIRVKWTTTTTGYAKHVFISVGLTALLRSALCRLFAGTKQSWNRRAALSKRLSEVANSGISEPIST